MALLRQHYRHRVFAAGARDVMELRPVYCSLAETTLAADEAIAAALALADAPSGFAVLALGRLGSGEFDVLSDADLIFLRSDETEARLATRTAEKLMTALAAYTRDGTVFAVDPRLRPHGGEGELVITPCQLSAYFTHEAQPWEALTYTKLRLVAGCQTLAEDASAARQKLLTRYARDPAFVAAVREMREKLERTDEGTNFKSAPGGFYDIDFIASYLSIREGISTPGNIHERLETLSRTGHLPSADAAELQRAAELVRTVEHVVRLVIGRRRKTLPRAEHARHVTEELTAGILRRRFQSGLAPELDKTFAAVRGIYEKIVS
jgi:glutamate-ammonia-ligase adenylyltransferase